MTTFNLTQNELAAALVLVKSCLDGMGGKRPADLQHDEYTWVSANDLMAAGWNKNEATGTFGALMEKGLVYESDRNEWVLATAAWQYLDTVWDAQTETPEENNTMTKVVAIVADKTAFTIVSEDQAQPEGTLIARSADDLEELSGPQAVHLYNVSAAAISASLEPVKRFSDKKSAAKRLWANFQDLIANAPEPAPAPAPVEAPKADKARDGAKPAKATDYPAPKTPRKTTGINLAPKSKVYACREGSKQSIMVDLLSRVQGATMAELLKGLSGGEKPWLEVTVKSGLNWDMNKLKGYGIRTTKRAEFDCYHLVLPKGLDKPIPHTPRKTGTKVDLAAQIKEWATENYSKSYGASALIETKTDEELRTEFKSLADAKKWAKLQSEMHQNAQG